MLCVAQDAFAAPSLDDDKFKNLDDLLKQSEMYATFLVENIKECEQQLVKEAEGSDQQENVAEEEQDGKAGKGAKKGGKRKAAAKGGRGAKRSKPNEAGHTRVGQQPDQHRHHLTAA